MEKKKLESLLERSKRLNASIKKFNQYVHDNVSRRDDLHILSANLMMDSNDIMVSLDRRIN